MLSDQEQVPQENEEEKERVPLGQIIFDDMFLWFLLSMIISIVIYNLWGLMELVSLPLAP